MGTPSAIAYKTPKGKIRAKYCHYDGDPENTGVTLEQHYKDARKIEQMVELGDQSYLAKDIFPTDSTHSFGTPQDGVTVFYGRDRGESVDVQAREFDTVKQFVNCYAGAGCLYFSLYSTETGWTVYEPRQSDCFEKLDAVLEKLFS